ncbi:MAG: site-specific integrase, partial [Gammaproteobacteria bacterium]|nr:site-specific integrase [Gammaproteobacteria bacterium]
SHIKNVTNRLNKDILPVLGKLPIADLTTAQVLSAVQLIEQRGAIETAHRVLGVCGQVFRYAVATGRVERDITADLRGALAPIKPPEHFAAVMEPTKIGGILRAIDGYDGTVIVTCALKLAPLVFVRPGELRAAEWKDIDFTKAQWSYRVTKTKTDHIVPLSQQAMSVLQILHPLTGHGRYLFPSIRTSDRPMSDNTILGALRRLGIEKNVMTGHGFRAVARTLLDEVLHYRVDYIEHQLAHAVRDPNGRAYNRTAHLEERTKMMQHWADYLDQLKNNDQIADK